MLEFPLNQLQTYYGYLSDLVLCSVCWQQRCLVMLKLVIFLSQTESTPKHFFRKKALSRGMPLLPPYAVKTCTETTRYKNYSN
jgi:hypothetical protein